MKCETCEDRQENEWWRRIQDRELGRYTAEWRKDTGQAPRTRPGVWSVVRWLERRSAIMERTAQIWARGDFGEWLQNWSGCGGFILPKNAKAEKIFVGPSDFCNLAYAIAEAEVDS